MGRALVASWAEVETVMAGVSGIDSGKNSLRHHRVDLSEQDFAQAWATLNRIHRSTLTALILAAPHRRLIADRLAIGTQEPKTRTQVDGPVAAPAKGRAPMTAVRTLRDLRPDTQRLARAFAVLDGPSLALASVAAVLDMPPARATKVAADLAAAEWGVATEDRFTIAMEAREYLAKAAVAISPAEVDHVLGHLAAAVRTHMN